jgi:S1-C subfamily serine protease
VLTLTLPAKGEKLAAEALSGHGASCPTTAVSGLLGVQITSPHGVVIGKVLPDGLGAKAGLKRGDSIIKVEGGAVTCPRSLVPFLSRTDKPREVKLTVIRAKASAAQSKPTASAAEKPAGE